MSRSEYEELRMAFTAAVSHELRTPLARLVALLESAELPNADLPALLRRARDEVGEMTELVDDILFLSELEQGREVVALGETEAAPVLRAAIDELLERAETAGIRLELFRVSPHYTTASDGELHPSGDRVNECGSLGCAR